MHINGNVADLILAQLAEWGVKRIYGVLGDAIFPLLDAIERQDKIKFIAATREDGAAFMASYEARVTGKIAVCAAGAGPGAASLLNGLADAFMDGIPVLAITGQVETKIIGAGAKQYFDQQSLFRTFSGHTAIITDPGNVTRELVTAVRYAYLKLSTAHISIPKDLLTKTVASETVPACRVEIKTPPPVSGNLEKVLAAARQSQKPLIVLGRQAKTVISQALKLADQIGAGLIMAQEAKGAIEGRHELNLGGLEQAFLPQAVQEADCIIFIGDAVYEKKLFPQHTTVVHISDRPENIYMNAAGSMTGDLNAIMEALLKGLENQVVNQDWLTKIKESARQRKQQLTPEPVPGAGPVHPLQLMAALNDLAPADAIIALDTGEFNHWFDLGFQGERQEVLLSSKWRSIGCGLPAAIGAKFACPDKTVLAIVGDGGFISSMSELLTCARYHLAITIIVVKNGVYSTEKNKMLSEGFTPSGHELTTPDFVQFARSCGVAGYLIENPADIGNAVRQALESGKPALLEVICADIELPRPPLS